MLSRLREPVSGLSHLAAAVAAAAGLALLLLVGRDSLVKALSLAVYGASLVLMFSASATYHLVRAKPAVVRMLRKLDHSAIYLLIAGTYTPICLHFFSGFWQWGMVAVIWALAVLGIVVKLFMMNAPRWLAAGLYLLMGWLALAAAREILAAMPPGALLALLLGGLFFTVGAAVYVTRKPDFRPGAFGFHELWHIFVILGCLCHFALMALYVAPSSPLPL
ncbi:MAG: hemolysin III family protein [Burkholderiaceae bacterium]|nr:hemolysin III family protein [Burkholderiaceae bacterium]